MVIIAKYRITGLSPLLMNNPSSMSRPKAGPTTKVIPTPEEEAAGKVYALDGGALYVPANWIRASMLNGSVGKRLGKVSARSRLQAAVFCAEDKCALMNGKKDKPIKDYEINTMRAVVVKAGVMRSRPEIANWCCVVVFDVDLDFVTPEFVEEFLNLGGKIAGVGDYRPQKGGPFGRYSAKLLS